jgi:hypothetical protein
VEKVQLRSFAEYAKDFYPELLGGVNEAQYQMKASGIPIFHGPSAYEEPKSYIEPFKVLKTIKDLLAKGHTVGLTANVPNQKGMHEGNYEVAFNVTGIEGENIKVTSSKLKRDYVISNPKNVDEIFILEQPFNESKTTDDDSAEAELNITAESYKTTVGLDMDEDLKDFCMVQIAKGKKSGDIMSLLGHGK